MRVLDGTLTTGQQELHQTPHVDFVLTSKDGLTTYDYASRILQLEHHEEVYNDYATVVLNNSDRAIENVKGYWVQIAYGLTVGGVDYIAATARLWVKQQINLSAEGQLKVMLQLEGVWSLMSEVLIHVGSPPFYDGTYENQTIYEVLADIIANLAVDTGYAFTLEALGDQDDGIINSFIPTIALNQNQQFENINVVVQSLLAMTYCWLRAEAGLVFRVVYPNDTETVDREYYSDQVLYFKENSDIDMTLVPNHFIVYANQDLNAEPGHQWDNMITAEAEDTTEQGAYVEVTAYHLAGSLVNQTDANNRTNVLLAKARQARFSGRLIVMHDAAIELFDYVGIVDVRGT